MPLLRVALTGGIATGKSYCLKRFEALGIPGVDADVLAREAVALGTPGLSAVVRRFGSSMVAADGSLNRPALAAVVFSDRTARADLEAIIHPEVYRRIREWFVNLPKEVTVAIADIPLLFETGHEHDFDRVVVVACTVDEQIRRLVQRDGLTLAAAQARLAAQWPIDEKVARADDVIRTDESFDETAAQVSRVARTLRSLSQ
jgi:dephospho-CoA kinase